MFNEIRKQVVLYSFERYGAGLESWRNMNELGFLSVITTNKNFFKMHNRDFFPAI